MFFIKDEDIVHANMKILGNMRETVWSLSVIRVKELKMSCPSTRGLVYLLFSQ